MALLMGSTMGLIMVVLMPPANQTLFYSLIIGTILISVVLIGLIRQQTGINQEQFAKGMVEHHEMAILMARQVLQQTNNPAVRQLAEAIITSQQREIDTMNTWIRRGFPSEKENSFL